MKIYKHSFFQKWVKDQRLTNETLKKVVDEIENGLHDGNLGGGLYKKRIAMPGKGKRGGYRTLLALKHNERAFFLYGFAKNVQANISAKEQDVYKDLAKALLGLDEKMLQAMITIGDLLEVK